ncbi:ABC transporter permease [Labrys wisconsinensis]|uniref:NitT/TauT family transport system permease protein n=1 Tax=Labrys wisconsinensis TaxID=425677 RepID=A0ABU0J693_9HYPH|nr:NitT/TauT family transport system permease protein [Labrys wisconsinensis]
MTTEAMAAPARPSAWTRLMAGQAGPVTVVVAVILLIWYAACVMENGDAVLRTAADPAALTAWDRVLLSFAQDRPVVPAPHQVIGEMWRTIALVSPFSRRSLIYHSWVTLSSALLGFAFGALLGIGLAVLIVHMRSLQKSLLPWIISSQTIPILALAPIVIVGLGSIGITGIVPKSIISTYLCFFPVTIGMVKGLTSPDPMQLDLMRTYNASKAQTFWKLRWPASTPFLFASLKVAIAISLVGAIVGELPTGAQAGLGARLLSGSYYGQILQIWAALFTAATIAAGLVVLMGAIERRTLLAMGARPEERP